MSEPRWIDRQVLLLAHAAVLAEHGGREGVRDSGLFDCAGARARNLYSYQGVEDLASLAACYAFGIVRNHPFVDGNKRAAFIALALFLALNGLQLKADQVDAYRQMDGAAAGKVSEEQLASWIRTNIIKRNVLRAIR